MLHTGRACACLWPPRPRVLHAGQRQHFQAARLRKDAKRCKGQAAGSTTEQAQSSTEKGLPEGAVDGFRVRPGISPGRESLQPATEDVPMDFYDAAALEDPEQRRRALDDLLVPMGHEPGTEVAEIPLHGMRKNDYTPFEFLSFLDEEIIHHITIQVDAPVSKVYAIWEDRLNWNEWFDLISQSVFHKDDDNIISLFMFYRWGQLPTIELYVTLKREAAEKDSFIIEKTEEGFPMAAAVFFREKDGGTEVNLRIAYALCAQLKEFVGPVGVYGSVNDILNENMLAMKEFVEGCDLEEVKQTREQDNKKMNDYVAAREKEIGTAYKDYFTVLEKMDDENIAQEAAEKAAEEAAANRPEPTQPNATASSPVTETEANPDAQNMSEFSPPEAEARRGYEGGGQDAEGSTSRFATPSGVRGSDFWENGPADSPQAQATTSEGATPEETRPGEAGAGQETDAQSAADATPSGPIRPNPNALEPPEQPKRKGRARKAKSGAEGKQITDQDLGGGSEAGGSSAADATPSGTVDSAAEAKPKRGRKAKASTGDGAAPKRKPRRAKASSE